MHLATATVGLALALATTMHTAWTGWVLMAMAWMKHVSQRVLDCTKRCACSKPNGESKQAATLVGACPELQWSSCTVCWCVLVCPRAVLEGVRQAGQLRDGDKVHVPKLNRWPAGVYRERVFYSPSFSPQAHTHADTDTVGAQTPRLFVSLGLLFAL